MGAPGSSIPRLNIDNGYRYWRWMHEDKRIKIAEHKLVMESILGRELNLNEQVRHKNEVRHDNRPENLYIPNKTTLKEARTRAQHKWTIGNGRQMKKDTNLRKNYGITLDDYYSMLASQGGVCKICSQPPKQISLAVDHDHQTGAVRGLLCAKCNVSLGWLENFFEPILNYFREN